MRKLILVRHGQSLGNIDPKFYKLPDSAISLSPRGVHQSVAAANILKNHLNKNSRIFTSRYCRAIQTSNIVQDLLDIRECIQDFRLNEVSLKESMILAQLRMSSFYKEQLLPSLCETDTVLFFHHNIMKSLIKIMFDLPDHDMYGLNIYGENAKPYIFEVDLVNKPSFHLLKLTSEELDIWKTANTYDISCNSKNPYE